MQDATSRRPIRASTKAAEAVQKAGELKPDLVSMDIGLPILNGVEADRQIRERLPDSKILFVTMECSEEV